MDKEIRAYFATIYSDSREHQNAAFMALQEITNEPVPWAYEIWDELLAALQHPNNRVRAIAAQLLINLAKSDPQHRMQEDFPALFAVTRDGRFVTARHCLQNIWKIGLVGKEQRNQVVTALETRYRECADEKNGTLIRYDVIQGLRKLYNTTGDEAIKGKAADLIAIEPDLKYRQKYTTLWKGS